MKLLKFMWLSTSAGVLLITLYLFDPSTAQDADLIITYGMLGLAFPSSVIVAGAIALLANATPLVDAYYGRFAIVVIWMLFVAVGYVQWFIALPWAVRKLRRQKHTVGTG
jgi:hypothetical protein